MAVIAVDEGLRSGLLALQLGLVTRETAAEAIRAWSYDDSGNLGQILADRGAIDAGNLSMIESIVRELGDDPSPGIGPTLVDFRPSHDLSTRPRDVAPDSMATRMPTPSEVGSSKIRFHRLRTHAEGGLGIIYVARDGELNREVALKEIKDHSADDPHSRARFLLEAEVTGGLEHPGIVPVYAKGHYPDGRPYYAMRLIRGLTLQETLDRYHEANRAGRPSGERALEFQKLLRTFLDVCNTIGYAHSRGVIHRDIKPNNVILGKFGETLVVDWGLAKAVDRPDSSDDFGEAPISPSSSGDVSATMAGSSVGTPGYMSPEQATGRVDQMGPPSDVFSLGATLYAILTGHCPYEGPDVWQVLSRVGRGEFPKPRDHDRSIHRAMEAICLKAMAVRPEDRYTSAAKLAEDVEHWLGDEVVSARPDSVGGRIARWGRKHRTAVRALVLILILKMIVAIIAAVAVNDSRNTEKIERLRAEALSSGLSLDRALGRLDRGEAGRGMLRLTQSLAIAPKDATDLRLAIRSNLGGWGRKLVPLKQTISHVGMVHALAFNDDGRTVVTGCSIIGAGAVGGQSQVWDVDDGTPVGPPLRHPGRLLAASFGSTGHRLLTGGSETSARLWNVETGTPIGGPHPHPGEILVGAFRSDGRRFAIAGADGSVQVWDSETGGTVGPPMIHPSAVLAVSFSPDGTRLLTGCTDGLARVWDAVTGRTIGESMNHGGSIQAVTYRPDGLRIATGGSRGFVRFWDATTNRRLETILSHEVSIYSIAYDRKGTRIVTGSEDDSARLWDAEDGRPLGIPLEHRGSVVTVGFAPDGKSIISGSGDRTVKLWDVGTLQFDPVARIGTARIEAIAMLPDTDSALIGGSDGKVTCLVGEGLLCPTPPRDAGAPIRSIVVRPRGGEVIVVTANGTAARVDPMTGRPTGPRWPEGAPIRAAAYSPDGAVVITGDDDGIAKFWDESTGVPRAMTLEHEWPIAVVAFHPNRPIAMTAGGCMTRLWNLETGKLLITLPTAGGSIHTAAFSPDGLRIATGGDDNLMRIWDVDTGHPVGLPMEHRASVTALAFSPDGRSIVTGSNDGDAILWQVATSKPLGPPMSHSEHVSSVAFDPSGKSILTGCHDRRVRRWPVPVPVPDDLEFVSLWVRATTGMELDTEYTKYGVARVLDSDTWRRDRKALDARGGPPPLLPY